MKSILTSSRFVSVLCVLGFGIVIAGGIRNGRAQSNPPTYRVLGANKDKTMERELNEAARQGCEPLIGIGASEYNEGMLVLRCP